jgi:hypothetical protein
MTRFSAWGGKPADLKMTLALGSAVVAAVAIALATSRSADGEPPHSEDLPPVTALAAPADAPPVVDSAAPSGEVLETILVSKYIYLRLRTSGGEIWAAVPAASIAVGSHVAIENATRMDDFKSTTLNRTFTAIYFGNLAAPAASASASKFSVADVPPLDDDPTLPADHPDIGNAAPLGAVNDSDPLPPGHPDIGAASAPSLADGARDTLPSGHPDISGASPHTAGGSNADPAPLPVVQIAPAQGSTAYVITQLSAQRAELVGHRVRVRGQVTKVTPDVNGRSFFHLRDTGAGGSEPAPDLVVTALASPQRGQIATFAGTLRTDVDVGIGYKYPVLLEDAAIVGE